MLTPLTSSFMPIMTKMSALHLGQRAVFYRGLVWHFTNFDGAMDFLVEIRVFDRELYEQGIILSDVEWYSFARKLYRMCECGDQLIGEPTIKPTVRRSSVAHEYDLIEGLIRIR